MKEWGVLTPLFKFYSHIISPIFDQDQLHYKYSVIIYHIAMFLPPFFICFNFSILNFIFKKGFEGIKESKIKERAIIFLNITQQVLNISVLLVSTIILTTVGGYAFLFTNNTFLPYILGFITLFLYFNIVWIIYYYCFSNSTSKDYCSLLFQWKHIPSFIISFNLMIPFIISLSTSNICSTFMPTQFSSSFSRSLSPDYCFSKICNVYLTITNETDGIIVNFHSKHHMKSSFIHYDYHSHQNISDYTYKLKTKVDDIKNPFINRFVNKGFLKRLKSGIIYLRISSDDFESQEFKFKMNVDEFLFIVGGDMGTTSSAFKMFDLAKTYEPSFIVIGGDIAYTNAVSSCYQRWDEWFDHVIKPSPKGFLIPLLTSVGNHDTGGYLQSTSEIPFYLHYFPHEDEPKYSKRKTFHSHTFNNLTLFILDSDHSYPLSEDGEQLKWLSSKLKENRKKFKIFIYHVPIYPSPLKLYNNIKE